jgi:NAD-dependent SIR2 family protein deacetylase
MAKCKHCGKQMPPTVLEAHINKSHNQKPDTKITLDPTAPVFGEIEEKGLEKRVDILEEILEEMRGLAEKSECLTCKELIPNDLMQSHVRITHGL